MELNPFVKDVGYLVTSVPTQDYFYPTPNGSGCLRLPKRVNPLKNNVGRALLLNDKRKV